MPSSVAVFVKLACSKNWLRMVDRQRMIVQIGTLKRPARGGIGFNSILLKVVLRTKIW